MNQETRDLIKNNDLDRYLISLIAGKKAYALMALLAVDAELSKIVAHHSDAMLGQIKLTWWREALEEAYETPDKTRQHPTLQFFKKHIIEDKQINLKASDLDPFIDGRITLIEDATAIIDYAASTSGTLFKLWQTIEKPDSDEESLITANKVGIRWGLYRTLKAIQFQILQQQGQLEPQTLVSLGIPEKDLFKGEGDLEANTSNFVEALVNQTKHDITKNSPQICNAVKLANYHCENKLGLLAANNHILSDTIFDQTVFKTLINLWWANLTKI